MDEVRILNVDESSISRAVTVLKEGGLVVFPTDTVYGVGAAVDRPDGVARLYEAKGRPVERAIPVLVSEAGAVDRLATEVDPVSRALMESFWPGPLTIVVPAASWLPVEIVRDTGGVGVRMPDHPVAVDLIRRSGGAIATTSANRSGEPETRTATEAAEHLGHRVSVVLDGGTTPGGVPSTVVRVEPGGELSVLRDGAISRERLEQVAASSS